MLLLFLCLAASRAAQLPGLATARCIRTQHLRVVVLAYDRPASLGTLLGSLDAVASDRDDVHLHIHVDRPRPGASAAVRGGVRRTVAVARSFRWRYGPPHWHNHAKLFVSWSKRSPICAIAGCVSVLRGCAAGAGATPNSSRSRGSRCSFASR